MIMELHMNMNKYSTMRLLLFKRRYELTLVQKLVLALGFACLTGLLAQLRFYLPGTPVPLTGQTFAVLFSAILLGKWWGGISQTLYLGIGVAGMPWFAGFNSGLAYLAGPTGGYLIGFIVAAFFLGYVVDSYIKSRYFLSMLGLMMLANFLIIYGCGLLQLYGWTVLMGGSQVSITNLLMMGLVPFVVGDLVKLMIAALIAKGITPKAAFGPEHNAY